MNKNETIWQLGARRDREVKAAMNKPTQHTPGPWTVGESAGHHIAKGIYAGFHIAEVVDITSGQADANARLIAAAPDLLAACKYAAQFSDCFIAAVITKRLNAAIAKAEGRDQ